MTGLSRRRWLLIAAATVLAVLAAAGVAFRDDVMRTRLDPKVPFQTYDPPAAPDYAQAGAWALLPDHPLQPSADQPEADVFFVSATTFYGGGDWLAPIDDSETNRLFHKVIAPNYAGPFVRVGRIFAPRYRQASLYTQMTLREDAREARRFAYGDVGQAFRYYLAHYNQGRPFIIVGVEQGGLIGERLLAEEVASKPDVAPRLIAAYLQDTVVPAATPPVPPCIGRGQTGCLAAWASVKDTEIDGGRDLLQRALVWTATGELQNLSGPALCFNPILGAVTADPAPARLALGAANATALEWEARPAFLPRKVAARCEGGLLRVSRPKSGVLQRTGDWADRRRAPGYNLFWADIESDAAARAAAMASRPAATPPASSQTAPAAPATPGPGAR